MRTPLPLLTKLDLSIFYLLLNVNEGIGVRGSSEPLLAEALTQQQQRVQLHPAFRAQRIAFDSAWPGCIQMLCVWVRGEFVCIV